LLDLTVTQRYDNVTLTKLISPSIYAGNDLEDDMASAKSKNPPMHFKTLIQAAVPQGRNGKHKLIVATILQDLDQLDEGSAIKVPLAALVESKEKVRSALNRATRKAGRRVATATDDTFLYVWNAK
jgi:hypothetical protein